VPSDMSLITAGRRGVITAKGEAAKIIAVVFVLLTKVRLEVSECAGGC